MPGFNKNRLFLIVLITFFFTVVYADPTPTFTPVTGVNSLIHKIAFDGDVLALTTTADAVYAGGNFQWAGPVTGCGVLLNSADGAVLPGMPPVADGYIKQIISDGAGGWYICGTFNYVAGINRKYLAHIYSNGSLDPVFNPAPNWYVNSITLSSGYVFAGGDFSIIGGLTRNRIAKLDAATGAADAVFNPNSNNTVNTLASDAAGNIYAGGTFSVIGTRSRYYLAKINPATGVADISFNPSPNWAVTTLYTDSASGLYVCGGFSLISLYSKSFIAKFDTLTGNIVTGFNPSPGSVVDAIVSDGSGNLFIGGQFQSVSGTARNYIAKISAANGALDTVFNPGADNHVGALAIGQDGSVYAGGKFMTMGGLSRYRIVKMEPVAGAVDVNFNKGMNGIVNSIIAEGTGVYAGGDFTGYGIEYRPYLLAMDNSGNILTGFNPLPNKAVNTLALEPGGALAAGGLFTDIGGLPRDYAARLDRFTGAADAGYNVSISGTAVNAIAFDGAGNEFIGGKFSIVGGIPRNNIAKVNSLTGALDATFNASVNNTVNAICLDGADIYMGGTFTGARPYLVKADAATGAAYTTFTASYLGGAVTCLSLGESSTIYAGGTFSGGLVRFDKTTGAKDSSFAADPDGGIYAIKPDFAGSIYAGGFFTFIGGDFRKKIARVSAVSGFADAGFYQSANNTVNAIAISTAMDALHAGGAFTAMSGMPAGKYAEFSIALPFTLTPTLSATISPTFSASPTPSETYTMTQTPTHTMTHSETYTGTVTNTPTDTATITQTHTITATPSETPTITDTETFTVTMTQTDTYSATPTFTETLFVSFTATPTITESLTPEDTASVSSTATQTFTAENTATVTETESNTPVMTSTPSFTETATGTETTVLSATQTASITITQTDTHTPTVTFTVSQVVVNTSTVVYTQTQTQTQTYAVSFSPTVTPTVQPGTEGPWLDFNNEKNIVLYPNPASNNVNFFLKSGHDGDKVVVSIYTVNLRLIYKKEHDAIATNSYSADISRFSNGLYIVRIVILKSGNSVYKGVKEMIILK